MARFTGLWAILRGPPKPGLYGEIQFYKNTRDRLAAWCRQHSIPNPLDPDKIHTTIAYSRKHVRDHHYRTQAYPPGIFVTKPNERQLEIWVDHTTGKNILVLKYVSAHVSQRWKKLVDAGATWDFPDYTPHITLSYDVGDLDISKLRPPRFHLHLFGEFYQPLDPSWDAK